MFRAMAMRVSWFALIMLVTISIIRAYSCSLYITICMAAGLFMMSFGRVPFISCCLSSSGFVAPIRSIISWVILSSDCTGPLPLGAADGAAVGPLVPWLPESAEGAAGGAEGAAD